MWVCLLDRLDPDGTATKIPATIKKGSNGADVKTLQTRLNANGAKLTVDGDFGPATEVAVKAYQKAKKLTADGIVGPQMWAALLK